MGSEPGETEKTVKSQFEPDLEWGEREVGGMEVS